MAISDDLGLYAHPRPAIRGLSHAAVIEEVARLVVDERIAEVVVGLPLSLSGEETRQTAVARGFATALRQRLSVPVTEWDERLTSVEAGRTIKGPLRRTGALDSVAASLLLQVVLDARRGGAGN